MADTERTETVDGNRRGWLSTMLKVLPVVLVVVVGGLILWNAAGRNDIDARLDALIEDARQMRVELQEMTARVKNCASKWSGNANPRDRFRTLPRFCRVAATLTAC